MFQKGSTFAACVLSGLAGLLAVGTPAAERTQPRVGKPDITGVWEVPFDSRYDSADAFNAKRVQILKQPPPLTPAYEAKWQENKAIAAALDTPQGVSADKLNHFLVQHQTECRASGMPAMMEGGVFYLEVLQLPHQVTIIDEVSGTVRRIYMNKPQRSFEEVDAGYAGHSVGRWEGDTLVVNTIGIQEDLPGPDLLPHSERLSITERIRLVAPDTLQDEITLEDPVALKRPYTYTIKLTRTTDEVEEYVCENDRVGIDETGKMKIQLQGEQ